MERKLFKPSNQTSANNPSSDNQGPPIRSVMGNAPQLRHVAKAPPSGNKELNQFQDLLHKAATALKPHPTPSNPSRHEVPSGWVSGVIHSNPSRHEGSSGWVSSGVGKREITASNINLDLKIADPIVRDSDVIAEARHRKKPALPQDIQAQPPALKPHATEKKEAADESLSSKKAKYESAAAAADAFEKELDKIYTEHEMKSKSVVSKTKTGKAASNPSQAPVPNEGESAKS